MFNVPSLSNPIEEDLGFSSLLTITKADRLEYFGCVTVDLIILQGELKKKYHSMENRITPFTNHDVNICLHHLS